MRFMPLVAATAMGNSYVIYVLRMKYTIRTTMRMVPSMPPPKYI
jgi:hypothetical protein